MRFTTFKDLTRFEQTLFALPFVLSSSCLAFSKSCFSIKWVWVFLAFLLARISGMAFNQLIDRHIDALNPRTQNRVLPSGRVSVRQATFIGWGSLFFFLLLCLQMNFLTACLAPLAALLIFVYSYIKRFHWGCHFVLGAIHFLAVIMSYSALTGSCSYGALFLALAAGLLIIGNDIIYALQDYAFDKSQGLFSFPSQFGTEKSLQVASLIHALCVGMLLAVGIAAQLFLFYYVLIPLTGWFFFFFHRIIIRGKKNLQKISASFFLCNISISFSTLFFIMSHLLWNVLL